MKKLTIKEQVLRFVETKGTARFTDIQRFIVDLKYGKGTYDSAARSEEVLRESKINYETGEITYTKVKTNPWRGHFSSAFTSASKSKRVGYFGGSRKIGYFLSGDNRLEKNQKGEYYTVRK